MKLKNLFTNILIVPGDKLPVIFLRFIIPAGIVLVFYFMVGFFLQSMLITLITIKFYFYILSDSSVLSTEGTAYLQNAPLTHHKGGRSLITTLLESPSGRALS